MPDWGICTTVRAAPQQVLAFVAHHLWLGAAHVWVHLDDPEDAVAERLARIPNVTAVRCDARWWGKTRPERHQNRQSRNMRRLYDQAPLPWIAHLDVDEFIDAPVILDTDAPMVRMRPWEALHDPALPDDIFTARLFRRAGPGHPLLPGGMLSHQLGKAFFRTGRGLEPRIHGAFKDGARVEGIGFDETMPLLHFHANDPSAWLDRLTFRLTRGAYANAPALRDHLLSLDAAGLAAFHGEIHQPTPETITEMTRRGMIRQATLNLRRKVDDLP